MVVLFTLIVEQCVMYFLATGQPENSETGAEVPLVFTLLVFGILGPILEEIVFRHILINRFSYHIGTAIASIISIMIFTSSYEPTFRYCYLFTWIVDTYCGLSYF